MAILSASFCFCINMETMNLKSLLHDEFMRLPFNDFLVAVWNTEKKFLEDVFREIRIE